MHHSTQDASAPVFSEMKLGAGLTSFETVIADDVISAVPRLPDKTSAAVSLPMSVLKLVIDVIALFIAELFNRSLATGQFPRVFKDAFITSVIKKPRMDIADPGSYWPISNVVVMSKLLVRLVAAPLIHYHEISNLLPPLQSGFWLRHSTETAVLRVLSDILEAVDCRNVAVFALLDRSAAFDTVDHDRLIRRLQKTYSINVKALWWFQWYLSGRKQSI